VVFSSIILLSLLLQQRGLNFYNFMIDAENELLDECTSKLNDEISLRLKYIRLLTPVQIYMIIVVPHF